MDDFCSSIKNLLSNRRSKLVQDAKVIKNEKTHKKLNKQYKLAAVLFPLIIKNNNYEVILTTRSKDVLSHPGQVCFPGGRLDIKDDSMIACAIREANEEVGIEPSQVEILGRLDDCITGTDFKVTPILGYINGNFIPKIQEKEVADLFRVPLSFFLEKSNRKIITSMYKNKKYSYYEYNWKEKKIWGSTARIIVNFCDIINNIK